MIKTIIYPFAILMGIFLLNSCEQTREEPSFSQPVIERYIEKNTFTVGGESVTTGPLKDYETDSEVVYRLTVTSEKPLAKFTVSSSSDAVSQLSRILVTEPAGVIDEAGNFTQNVNKVIIYYSYHIHPLIAASSQVMVTFTILNNNNNASSVYHTLSVIKKGSTDGKLLNVIDLQYTNVKSRGIGGCEGIVDESEGIRPEAQGNKSGPLFSFKYKMDFTNSLDAIANAKDIDLAGYRAWVTGTDPKLTASNLYLVSPSDTTVLNTTFAGATAAAIQLLGSSGTANITLAGLTKLATFKSNTSQTATDFVNAHKAAFAAIGLTLSASGAKLSWVATKRNVGFEPVKVTALTGNLDGVNDVTKVIRKNLIVRNTMRQMAKKLKDDGKDLRTVYFKRLDNIVGPNRVTAADFDILTHDNEFDTLLAGIREEGVTITGVLDLDQVYGFVMSDGKRGLIRTMPATIFLDGNSVTVAKPNSSFTYFGMIKYQNGN